MIGEQEQNKVWILMIIARSVAVRLLIDTCKYDVNVMLYHYVIGMKWEIQCILSIALRCVPVSGSNNTKFRLIIIPGTLSDDAHSSMCRASLIHQWQWSCVYFVRHSLTTVGDLTNIHTLFILCWPVLDSWITLMFRSMRFLDHWLITVLDQFIVSRSMRGALTIVSFSSDTRLFLIKGSFSACLLRWSGWFASDREELTFGFGKNRIRDCSLKTIFGHIYDRDTFRRPHWSRNDLRSRCLYHQCCTCPLPLINRQSFSVPRSFLAVSLQLSCFRSIALTFTLARTMYSVPVLHYQSSSWGIIGGSRLILSCGILSYLLEFLTS